ncbi:MULTISPECIES: SURF1 family protein [unclassified Leisingera]|uniref:SURF1 family protein n=1 Tax=unclassified Leisingera TaxID=2614906 RepID=UPI0002DE12A8|nr:MULTISPECIES: SURF1 family protein [unclassified Leisingera]KIC26157.1 cytochrome oxidase biogenesis protein Surf1, facilitates heme A insertion [Leisingera sp. ANG-S3]KIC55037.1 cytochrome oxidase biogenesis protein Surf1, facilitates heme A insertion [Leisingera sp. ANG-S]KID08447.1 cytochrome oxidase biogenesis protein Surf1, facilitates heme A insertion [Leisingera sp. ANG1]
MRRVIFLLIIGGAGLAILIGLGTWQLQRMGWKEDLLQTIEASIAAAPAALPQVPVKEQDRYRAVTVEGEIEGNALHVFWVTKDAETGYRVIAPFVTTDGRRVLLDRGFIPAAEKTTSLSIGQATVTGNLLWPDEGDWTTPAPEVDTNILYARDVAYMAERLNTEPVLIVARSTAPEAAVTPQAVTTAGIPNNHLQYAITWFSLAFIWAAMTVYFLRRSRP